MDMQHVPTWDIGLEKVFSLKTNRVKEKAHVRALVRIHQQRSILTAIHASVTNHAEVLLWLHRLYRSILANVLAIIHQRPGRTLIYMTSHVTDVNKSILVMPS
jgi:hypothetical protein